MTSKLSSRVGLCVALTLALLALAAAPALAAEEYGFTSAFGTQGSGEGQFSEPDGVAVDGAAGEDVYVVDKGNNRVEWFSATGEFRGQFNGSGAFANEKGKTAPLALAEPEAIAVDNDASSPSYGDVYVVDSSQRVIDRFSATGEYLGQLTKTDICETEGEFPPCAESKIVVAPFTAAELGAVTVDSKGNLWVENRGGIVLNEFGATGGFEQTIHLPYGLGGQMVAVDSEGDLYTPSTSPGEVLKLGPAGEVLAELSDQGSNATAVAVAPSTNSLIVDEGSSIAEFAPFAEGGVPLGHFAVGRLTASAGIAVGANDLIYASDSTADTVSVFTPGVGEPPVISAERATTSGQAAAAVLLEASVNPNHRPTFECEFRYGTDPSLATSTTVACEPEEFGGKNFVGEQSVKTALSGLTAGETYYFRVVATNTTGKTGEGKIESFRMPDVPVLSITEAQGITGATAGLSGEVNPDGAETVYHFAYIGQAGYEEALAGGAEEKADPYAEGETTPAVKLIEPGGAPDVSDLPRALAETLISGLRPGRIYHYALVAYNIVGTTVTPDRTFTTPPGTPPLAVTGPASAISQNAATLSGSVTTNGLQTNYGFEIATGVGGGQISYGPATGLGSIGGAATETVSARLTKLAPGTTYYYRVTATNADGTVQGEPQVFTTPGFPSLIAVPGTRPALAPLNIAFPKEEKGSGTTTKPPTRAQKLAAALKACHRKHATRRTSCERTARKRFGPAKKRGRK